MCGGGDEAVRAKAEMRSEQQRRDKPSHACSMYDIVVLTGVPVGADAARAQAVPAAQGL